ncbi:CbtA family protein [Mycobacterium yunnanensis]|uniref:CbtA family protein n=1 Tax=Mycobacterium yunnanensis TaxID=368477 RepID=A0A9X2YIK4_9MYCO|nr:CbtA family protein [Mycobacterium yunnanensis]MCV7419922.1 CbtA family protein [Mycobacterium yunnanensis]
MEKKYIGFGVGSGLIAGLASFGYARLEISPLIEEAIGYEEGRAHAESSLTGEHGHEHEVFTRALQENVGAGVGTLVFGLVMGALFAVAFSVLLAALRRRGVAVDPRAAAVLLAAVAFVSTTLVPALAYPPNPPGVGLEDTIGDRTSAYLTVVVASVTLATVAVAVGLRLVPRVGGWTSGILATVGYLAATATVVMLMPSFHEVPGPMTGPGGDIVFAGFPAEVLSEFRIDSLLAQAILWFVIASGFVVMLPRAVRLGAARPLAGALHGDR